ncbi:uncharacterized protein LOC142349409 [Convolutriloba macropyga]|uniref:uncharacterized protein LOC142349409 n=1 Tax=Convolutriloba macropyga TaxID=536237 RepID=UPI003F5244D8
MAAFAKKWGGRINEVLVKTGNWGQYYGTKLQIVAPERANALKHFARVELAPPTVADFVVAKKQIAEGFNALLNHGGQITMKRAVQNLLIAGEISVIFFTAEVIGRRSLVGYNPMGDPLREIKPPPGMAVPLPEIVQYLELSTMYENGLYHFGPAKNY